MSLNLSTSITMTSNSPLSNHIQNKKLNPFISTIRVLHHKSQNPNHPKQNQAQGEEGKGKNHKCMITDRRDVLFGLGAATLSFSNQNSQLISIAAPDHKHSSRQHNHKPTTQLPEFGSKPRILDGEQKTIRVLVKRPKEIRSKKPELAELLVVDGIEVHRNGPVRFEVYVAKAHDDVVGPDLGQFAGSLVNLPFNGDGKNGVEVQSKGRLELGIGALVKELEAQDCEKIAVSLVPRIGQVMIGDLRIEAV